MQNLKYNLKSWILIGIRKKSVRITILFFSCFVIFTCKKARLLSVIRYLVAISEADLQSDWGGV
jgi:hypothetical protein